MGTIMYLIKLNMPTIIRVKYLFKLFTVLQCLIASQLFSQTSRPNIIFILSDDQRWNAVGYMNNNIIRTPEIDALAKAGTYFENAFSTTPICAASRASIFTGTHERTHGYTFQKPKLKEPYAQYLYPKILKENNYHVGFFGKLGILLDSASSYFDESEFYDRSEEFGKKGYFYKTIGKDTVHLTRYTGHKALQFINNAPLNKPFCLSLFFSAPHAHDNSIEQYYNQNDISENYGKSTIPPPFLSDSIFFKDLPKEVQAGYNKVRWRWRFDTPEKYQQSVKAYYQMITELDHEIGLIRKQLIERGIDKNTVIIVMSDNGYFLGDRQIADKWLMYDPSIRIPLLIFDPRVNNPTIVKEMVLNLDIPKTILQIAKVNPPDVYQGIGLPILNDEVGILKKRKSILIEHLWDFDKIPSSEGIRTDRWKYFHYRHINAPEELYDLKKDPLEKTNLAANKKYRKTLQLLRNKFFELSKFYEAKKLCPDDPFIKDQKF